MMDFLNIKNKHFLITGASGGIGRACCILLSEFGAKLTITGRNEHELIDTAKACENEVQITIHDLSAEEETALLADSLSENIDGLVHTAGIVKPLPIKFIKTSHYNEVMNINLRSAILLSSTLLKKKRVNQGSSFVFLSSISAQHPYIGGSLYVSSKAALEAFVKTLALEHSGRLRANLLAPALVKTNIFDKTQEVTGEEEIKEYEKSYPLGFGEPEDVANACGFLLSSRSKWITGTVIKMDGGLLISGKS